MSADQMGLFAEPVPVAEADCQWPHHAAETGYLYGCRCSRCRQSRALTRARAKSGVVLRCRMLGCTNPRRRVQGARYCDEHATSKEYVPGSFGGYVMAPCEVCGEIRKMQRQKKYPLCYDCRSASVNLVRCAAAHHVGWDVLLRWIRNPQCHLCGRAMYAGKSAFKGGAGAFGVDHDHRCCGSSKSCGKCVRGLLCVGCNTGIGHLERLLLSTDMDGLQRYIDRATATEE